MNIRDQILAEVQEVQTTLLSTIGPDWTAENLMVAALGLLAKVGEHQFQPPAQKALMLQVVALLLTALESRELP